MFFDSFFEVLGLFLNKRQLEACSGCLRIVCLKINYTLAGNIVFSEMLAPHKYVLYCIFPRIFSFEKLYFFFKPVKVSAVCVVLRFAWSFKINLIVLGSIILYDIIEKGFGEKITGFIRSILINPFINRKY